MRERENEVRKAVREHYGQRAKQATSCCSGSAPVHLPGHAQRLYSQEELAGLPEGVTNIAAGCGNPTALAELKPGEVVLDLGSGGGIDCFLAAQQVGAEGMVIGVDMTPEMVYLARSNAEKMRVTNVEFRLGELEHMPVESNSVDVIISNCVINLSPDKDSVFREAFRVLKPGGRVTISDIALIGELPEKVRQSLEQWAGCVAGALKKDVYLDKVRAAGFVNVTAEEINPVPFTSRDGAKNIVSLKVKARKPT